MEAIHNLAVTMGKKMDAMMSTLSEIKKKQDHLALELKQVCPPMPVTGDLDNSLFILQHAPHQQGIPPGTSQTHSLTTPLKQEQSLLSK